MELSIIDNAAKTLHSVLDAAFPQAKQGRLAVAFVKHSGFSLIEENLNRCLTNGGNVEFMVGLNFCTTEPRVLRRLHQLSRDGLKVKCYCFSDPSTGDAPVYHPKVYLLANEEMVTISVGSSNLTRGGLRDNVETNVVMIANPREEIVSDVYALYNRLKFHQTRFEPDLEYIDTYQEAYDRVAKRNTAALKEKRTKEILGILKEREKALPKPKPAGPDLFGWQRLVYEKLPSVPFRTGEVYPYEQEFQEYYPENRNIRAKVRQVLQQLRDMGLLSNPQRDRWERV